MKLLLNFFKGALILGGESKLIENNIPTANGYLHLTDTVLVPSFVLPIVQKYCENNITKVYVSQLNFLVKLAKNSFQLLLKFKPVKCCQVYKSIGIYPPPPI